MAPNYQYTMSRVKPWCRKSGALYITDVPKLWKATIEAHRQEVGDAILDTTAALTREQGLRAVTMSQIAETVGIGRATLYKYYPDVETILVAWHERHAAGHLERLAQLRAKASDPRQALESVLGTCALMMFKRGKHGGREIAALVHQERHVVQLERRLHSFVRDVVADAAKAGVVRGDIPPDELATYCLHALTAASAARSEASLERLVDLTLAGIRQR
jgi:AcrR family transcriptional regulator